MYQEINKSRHLKALCMHISASKKHDAQLPMLSKQIHLKLMVEFYKFVVMKEQFHRGALLDRPQIWS